MVWYPATYTVQRHGSSGKTYKTGQRCESNIPTIICIYCTYRLVSPVELRLSCTNPSLWALSVLLCGNLGTTQHLQNCFRQCCDFPPQKHSHIWPQKSLIHLFTNHKGIWWQFAVYWMQDPNKLHTDLILLRAIDIDFFSAIPNS